MLKKEIITLNKKNKKVKKEINVIPTRFIIAILISIVETLLTISIVGFLTYFIPYFWILIILTMLVTAISIINREDNPDYKLPWLFFVMLIPIVGFMLYFMFYSRKLKKKQIKRIDNLMNESTDYFDIFIMDELKKDDERIYGEAALLTKLSNSHVYKNTDIKYFTDDDGIFNNIINDLKTAQKFIFLEYFIIEGGKFWDSILEILKQKVSEGIEVRILYDDIGCMMTLPGNYFKKLRKMGFKAYSFNMLKGQANNEFNNRNHRKILIIDGMIGYTGGINIADEYINEKEKYGWWKDSVTRLHGMAVNELTRLFLLDYSLCEKKREENFKDYYGDFFELNDGYCIPYGDGPKPIYKRGISRTLILNMLNNAKTYVYITTPYIIVDNEIIETIENASLRGVNIKIITPHIPDKKVVFRMTRSHYKRLMDSGVEIYEYTPGFIHQKTYLADDELALVGTINLDYRSLVHHFEDGVWIYKHKVLDDIKADFLKTIKESQKVHSVKNNLFARFINALVRIFSPLL